MKRVFNVFNFCRSESSNEMDSQMRTTLERGLSCLDNRVGDITIDEENELQEEGKL